ncbi:WD repeat-containing protein JIP5 [Smittium culicis]|uniref:WD repeat-containing protein JIP5 n=1 Tax=Smittium culicis TaxID=133412 RepID=A0A1R1X412_9FUNG|nr:WD repeat-containing protein JIP5 [Smittium culicis]
MKIEIKPRAPINRLLTVNEQMIATGDDDGCVKLWDIRQKKLAFTYEEHVDYISSMNFNQKKRHLLVTSGDGCLSVYDVRKSKPIAISDNQDDELLSSSVIRNGTKLAVGLQSGCLGIFSYGQFGDVTDRVLGNPSSIEHLCKINEDTLVTAGGDGYLRVLQLFPHKYTRVLGRHGSLPVEKAELSHDRDLLVSYSQDSRIRFWDVKNLTDSSNDKFSWPNDKDSSGSDSDSDSDDSNSDGNNPMAVHAKEEIEPRLESNTPVVSKRPLGEESGSELNSESDDEEIKQLKSKINKINKIKNNGDSSKNNADSDSDSSGDSSDSSDSEKKPQVQNNKKKFRSRSFFKNL